MYNDNMTRAQPVLEAPPAPLESPESQPPATLLTAYVRDIDTDLARSALSTALSALERLGMATSARHVAVIDPTQSSFTDSDTRREVTLTVPLTTTGLPSHVPGALSVALAALVRAQLPARTTATQVSASVSTA